MGVLKVHCTITLRLHRTWDIMNRAEQAMHMYTVNSRLGNLLMLLATLINSLAAIICSPRLTWIWRRINKEVIGASLSEPHLSNGTPRDLYLCLVCHSANKCPRVLIHWTASILQCVIKYVHCMCNIEAVLLFECDGTYRWWACARCS